MTCIMSGIYGGFDKPKVPIPQSIPVRYVMVTDNPLAKAPGWDMMLDVELAGLEEPRLCAKRPKLRPWMFAPNDGPWIWVDGSMQIVSRHFAREAIAAVSTAGIGQWEHPDRDCALTEAMFSTALPKYADTPLEEQAATYIMQGHPNHWGLWATGLIVYRRTFSLLPHAWWVEMEKWGVQDQVSEPYVLRNLGMRPDSLPHGLRDNPWLRIVAHRDGTS